MFTTIMYGFINEVTRQPATADIPLDAGRRAKPARVARRLGTATRPAAKTAEVQAKLPGTYRVFADSFKCAAGFN